MIPEVSKTSSRTEQIMQRTFSSSDRDLLRLLPVFKETVFDRSVTHGYLHPLLDFGLSIHQHRLDDQLGLDEVHCRDGVCQFVFYGPVPDARCKDEIEVLSIACVSAGLHEISLHVVLDPTPF